MKKICFILIMSLFVLNSSVPVSASESIRQQVKNIFANKKKAQRNDLNKIKNVLEKKKKKPIKKEVPKQRPFQTQKLASDEKNINIAQHIRCLSHRVFFNFRIL